MAENSSISWTTHTKSGPPPYAPRDGDKRQARQRINVEVRTGYRPHPNTLPCVDCGHIWRAGERRHEYDHHLGYGADHHYDVEPVCTACHVKRDGAKANQTHCIRGHEFTPGNTYVPPEGGRSCRECHRMHDRNRGRDAAYWRAYRAKKRSGDHFKSDDGATVRRIGKKRSGRTIDGVEHNAFPEVRR